MPRVGQLAQVDVRACTEPQTALLEAFAQRGDHEGQRGAARLRRDVNAPRCVGAGLEEKLFEPSVLPNTFALVALSDEDKAALCANMASRGVTGGLCSRQAA